ncbi:(Fe-S)-binding protein [Haloplasma contractile]|uniref:Acetyl-CoA decarbonylase-synthase complex subunit gamma protein n=1 Tax=Haloplasma contractile SSD-17B TaxID=1033810 RepID=U2FSB6_9MOLU|nr:(Fe-S)-binding protein [Haloplasma contractile]ERJ13834.1 acetyl-CoA decarbonylase-synthase complex subunit gamma protein [Haloplasma contractile SSD-17B]
MDINVMEILAVGGIVGGIGAVLGLILAISSQVFKVEVDPRFDQIVEALPGFNCGACGYPGCAGMADGLLEGEADVKQCTPGTELNYSQVRAILNGEDPDSVEVKEEKKAPAKADAKSKPKRKKPEIKDVTNPDPRFDKIVELLPGINCTTCGSPGCKAFADELIKGEQQLEKCRPLKAKGDNKDKIDDIMNK